MANSKTIVKNKKMSEARLKTRGRLWTNVSNNDLWIRTERDGFSTIPRTLVNVSQVFERAHKGKGLTRTYLSLWCRVFDEGFVKIDSPTVLAFESGFTGQRMVITWGERMRILEELGFIKSSPGASGEFSNVLLMNPLKAVRDLYSKKLVDEDVYNALLTRMDEIGATDLDD